ncbi:MAG: hypothetical protein ACMUIP_15940 [bacterium]
MKKMLFTESKKTIVSIIIVSFLLLFTLFARAYADDVKKANNLSNTLTVTGLALAFTGLVIMIASRHKPKENKSASLNPSLCRSAIHDTSDSQNQTHKQKNKLLVNPIVGLQNNTPVKEKTLVAGLSFGF